MRACPEGVACFYTDCDRCWVLGVRCWYVVRRVQHIIYHEPVIYINRCKALFLLPCLIPVLILHFLGFECHGHIIHGKLRQCLSYSRLIVEIHLNIAVNTTIRIKESLITAFARNGGGYLTCRLHKFTISTFNCEMRYKIFHNKVNFLCKINKIREKLLI